MPSARLPILSSKKQRRLHFLLDQANAGKLTPQQSQELEKLIEEAQLLTFRKAHLLARALVTEYPGRYTKPDREAPEGQ